MFKHRPGRSFVVVFVLTLVVVLAGKPAWAYIRPVAGAVVDPFRAPVDRYASGNRGIEYATQAGDPVVASESGIVTFAGQVGGTLYVIIQHDDGLRSTYGGLSRVSVPIGARIDRGAFVGTSSDRTHFGIRRGDEYLDPALLLDRAGSHLVP